MRPVFLVVRGVRSTSPQVLAGVGEAWVSWNPRRGWECDCDEPDDASCSHVDLTMQHLDPKVLNDTRRPPTQRLRKRRSAL